MLPRNFDLSNLQRLFNGDRSSVEEWIHLYLEEAPPQFKQLMDHLNAGNAEGLAFTAHDLRPQAHYLGSPLMLDLLIAIGKRARTDGAAACAEQVGQLLALSAQVDAELRTMLQAG